MARNRCNFTSEFKAKIVLQLISRKKSLAEICLENKLNHQMVSRWKSEFLE
jgi:transposase-like protein